MDPTLTSAHWMKQPMSSTHLKVLLGCLLENGRRGGKRAKAQESYSKELLEKLQENLTEVL